MKKVKAFAFSVEDLAEETMFDIEEKLGKNHEFFTEGKWITNKASRHQYEYWTTQAGSDAVNKLYKKQKQ